MSIWLYKRMLLLLAAYGGALAAMNLFPDVPIWSVSAFLGEVLFSPFKLLIAVLLFTLGFLSYSLFVRDFFIILQPTHFLPFKRVRLLFVIVAFVSWFHLITVSVKLALLVLLLALWYGIMDAQTKYRT